MSLIIDNTKELYKNHREIISYAFWGVLTTVVSWVSYALFVWIFEAVDFSGFSIFGAYVDHLNVSNILSWICGVSFAFVVNKWFVFLSKSTSVKIVLFELGSFFGSRIFTGAIAMVLFPILYSIGLNQTILGTDGLLAKIITSIMEIILNWVFSKYLVFKNNSKDQAETE